MLPQAVLPLLTNALVAAMFVASFLTIAYLNPSARNVRWIALSYAIGMLEPIADLALVMGARPEPVMIGAPAAFLVGAALMSPALSIFHGKRPRWPLFAAIVVAGVAYFGLTLDAGRMSYWYQFGYQLPFAAAVASCALTVWRDAPRSVVSRALCGVFLLTAAHFLLKPFAAMYFGVGATERDYAGTLYAVLSQASSGLLLVGAGLLILIAVLQSVVHADHQQARTDPLTGLPNRRALHEAFERLVGRLWRTSASLAIVDVDRFKSINDRFGHDRGDEVLRGIAECLDRIRPAAATVARLGGEEFVLLLPEVAGDPARLLCESMRLSISRLDLDGLPPVTVSIGLTSIVPGDDLADVLRRADRALYEAKRLGRDRCVVATAETTGHPHLALVGARPRG